jgi:hypothetical protein
MRLPPTRAGREVAVEHCKFRTSFGGTDFCQDPRYLEGFCRFHYDALLQGDINEHGVINEHLSDQDRRREINFHGIRIPSVRYLDERS